MRRRSFRKVRGKKKGIEAYSFYQREKFHRRYHFLKSEGFTVVKSFCPHSMHFVLKWGYNKR